MPYDLSNLLVVGISSRALFDLEHENSIFETRGLQPFLTFQRAHEQDILKPGTGFHLVRSLLALNNEGHRKVEVIVVSRNHPDVYLRVSTSILHYGLDVTRSMQTGGEPLHRYLRAYKIDLFLSAKHEDVVSAIEHGIAAGRIYAPPAQKPALSNQIRIAFDGDCVLFSEEAELINREVGLAAFHEHEHQRASIPLPDGPFANLIRTIASMQGETPEASPFRIGLVTARNSPSHERALRTLRGWNVRVDSAAFLGGLPKDPWLAAFGPQIFFDDQEAHCGPASHLVPTAIVPFPITSLGGTTVAPVAVQSAHKNQFLLICKGYLKRDDALKTPMFEDWYAGKLAGCHVGVVDAFLEELAASVDGTPVGAERPGRGESQTKAAKFVDFLDALLRKHQRATNG